MALLMSLQLTVNSRHMTLIAKFGTRRPVNPRGSDITTYRFEAEVGGGIQESYIMPLSSLGHVTTEDHCCLCRCQMKKQVPHKLGALLDTCTKA